MADGQAPPSGLTTSRREVLRRVAAGLALVPILKNIALAGGARKPAPAFLRGVALAGAEFGQLVPGQFGREYTYPGSADFAFCVAQGFNAVRLPFKWERLQPSLGQPFDTVEWSRLATAIGTARKTGLSLILDPHNYARRRVRDDNFTAEHLIGSDLVPVAAFVAFWRELAGRCKSDAHVIFGLMNEPADFAARTWLDIANLTLAAIRQTGAQQLVLIPGTAYTGAHSWIEAGNTVLEAVEDPAGNFAIEVHQYLDKDSSGTSGPAVSDSIGSERLQAFQRWARARSLKAFLGEFGAGSDTTSLRALDNIVHEVENNRDVWIGWTAWAAGPWWPDSEPLRLSPDKAGGIPPQTQLLSGFARAKP